MDTSDPEPYPSNVKEEGLYFVDECICRDSFPYRRGGNGCWWTNKRGELFIIIIPRLLTAVDLPFVNHPTQNLYTCATSSLKNRCKITFHLVFANLLCLNIAAFKNSAPHYLHDDRLLSRFFSCISPPSFLAIVLLIWCAHLSSRSRWKKSLPTLTLFYFYFIYPLVVRKVDWLLPSNVVWTGRVMRGSHSSSSSIVPVARAHFARTPPL